MASKSDKPADEPEAIADEASAQVAPASEASVDEQGGDPVEAEADASVEPEVDEIAGLNAKPIPMQHADGNGVCDRYEANKAGHLLVPAAEAHLMLEHGFVVVEQA